MELLPSFGMLTPVGSKASAPAPAPAESEQQAEKAIGEPLPSAETEAPHAPEQAAATNNRGADEVPVPYEEEAFTDEPETTQEPEPPEEELTFVEKVRRGSTAMLGFFNPKSPEGGSEGGSPSKVVERARQIVRRGSASVASMVDLVSKGPGQPRRFQPSAPVGTKEYRSEAWAAAVSRCVLLRALTAAEIDFVRQATKVIKVKAGEILYRQGDVPNMLYLVHSGCFEAKVEGTTGSSWTAREYGAFDSFGGCEMLIHEKLTAGRCCTITALQPGVLWGVPQRIVDLKLRVPPPVRAGMDVSGLQSFTRALGMLNALSNESLTQLNRCAAQVTLEAGEVLCEAGDPARAIYAIHSGVVNTMGKQAGSEFEFTMTSPMTFGESALVYEEEGRVRQAKIVAGETGATLVKWAVNEIETLIGYELHAASERAFTCKFFEPIKCGTRSITTGLSMDEVSRVVSLMTVRTFSKGDIVVGEGKVDEEVFVIKSGSAIAKRPAEATSGAPLAMLSRGECFGEQALVAYNPAGASKPAKRRVSIVANGTAPLVTFVISPPLLLEKSASDLPFLRDWISQLAADVQGDKDIMAGLDAIVRQKAKDDGVDMTTVLAKNIKKGKRGSR